MQLIPVQCSITVSKPLLFQGIEPFTPVSLYLVDNNWEYNLP
jgi:hypothetical protein